jgi:H+/Cl- antiporter ClcA
MENNYSNYDMLDKLIANNKKAKSWTAFWIIALCLLAGAVLWMAFDISQKKKTINEQKLALQTRDEFLEVKNHLIDSLVANCNVAKTEIVKSYDSAIVQTEC